MSWMNMLYRTYENNSTKAGTAEEGKTSLSPVSHIIANAQLEISVSDSGDFINAREVDKSESKTIIPVTQQSAGRAGGTAPHALCDTLTYIAKDYADYAATEKEKKKSSEKFEAYISALRKWASSDYSHKKVRAISAYLEKGCVMADLISAGLVSLDENGKLSNKKIQGKIYEKALVRFRVISENEIEKTGTWEDSELFNCYTDFYLKNQGGYENICFVKGQEAAVCVNHPKGIVAANYGAKLISSNDKQGFTYRGRFIESDDACTISYEATQKAHNALTWIAANQGDPIGTQDKRTYICWNPDGKKTPPLLDPFHVDNEEPEADTEPGFKKHLFKTFMGYRGEFNDVDNDDIVTIALDAATTGRLSVTYYNELKASDFLKRIERWGETLNWYFTRYDEKKHKKLVVMSPLFRDTAKYAFGNEQGNFVELKDNILKEQSQRILHCMLDAQPIPRDIVHALAQKASTPLAYKNSYNYENVLSTACAYIRKNYNDKNKGVKLTMDLQNEITDRSYLFGRLLAICENIEEKAMQAKFKRTHVSEDRDTNAARYINAFSHYPMHTFKILKENLKPYMSMLSVNRQNTYNDLIGDIFAAMETTDVAKMNLPLDDKYLIGYYLQRRELRKKTTNNEEE